MTGTTVAFTAVVATATVGVLNPWIQWLISRQAQKHERELARTARLFERRSEVYCEVLTFSHAVMRDVDTTRDRAKAREAVEAMREGREMPAMIARLAVFGTREVYSSFQTFLIRLYDVRDRIDESGEGEAVKAAERAADDALEQLERRVNGELDRG